MAELQISFPDVLHDQCAPGTPKAGTRDFLSRTMRQSGGMSPGEVVFSCPGGVQRDRIGAARPMGILLQPDNGTFRADGRGPQTPQQMVDCPQYETVEIMPSGECWVFTPDSAARPGDDVYVNLTGSYRGAYVSQRHASAANPSLYLKMDGWKFNRPGKPGGAYVTIAK